MDRGLGTRFCPPDPAGSDASIGSSNHRGGDRGPGLDRRRGHGITTPGTMRVLVALLVIAAAPSVAIGQQRWERQVQERVQRAITAVGTSSRLPVVKRSGMLNTDEAASFQTTLVERTSYAIVAV